MAQTTSVRELYSVLEPDELRARLPFSSDMTAFNALLTHANVTEPERKTAINDWVQSRRDGYGSQPCLFGRIAAARDRMHYCVLTEQDLMGNDESIAQKILHERREWKRRSLRPRGGINPAHGFILLAASERLMNAAPDETLYRLACRLRELWGCPTETDVENEITLETLFLQHPVSDICYRFTFSVDFFGAQGDGRWWRDHRVPGGIAFTANSAGHMRRFREWYENRADQTEWTVMTAMDTIHSAASTPYGKATWLESLGIGGKPIVDNVACPFAAPSGLRPHLKFKDWTRYGGHHYSDHSIRKEFFLSGPDKTPELKNRKWLESFTYLYNKREKDHIRFMEGQAISLEEIEAELGPVAEWRFITERELGGPRRRHEDSSRIEELLAECAKGRMTEEELRALNA